MTEKKEEVLQTSPNVFFLCATIWGWAKRRTEEDPFHTCEKSISESHALPLLWWHFVVCFFVPKQAKKLTKKMMVFDGWRLYHHQQSSPGKKTVGQFSPLHHHEQHFAVKLYIFFLTFSFKSLKGNKFPTFGFLIFPSQYKHFLLLLNLDQITAPNPLRN